MLVGLPPEAPPRLLGGEIEELVVSVTAAAPVSGVGAELVIGASAELVVGAVNDEDELPGVARFDELVVGAPNGEGVVVGFRPLEPLVVGVVEEDPLPPLESPLNPPPPGETTGACRRGTERWPPATGSQCRPTSSWSAY